MHVKHKMSLKFGPPFFFYPLKKINYPQTLPKDSCCTSQHTGTENENEEILWEAEDISSPCLIFIIGTVSDKKNLQITLEIKKNTF